MSATRLIGAPKISNYQALERLSPQGGSGWLVWFYLLNKDIVPNAEGNNSYGALIFSDYFENKEEAVKRAEELMELTGTTKACVTKVGGKFIRLTELADPEKVLEVYSGKNISKEEILELQERYHKRKIELYEQRRTMEEQMLQRHAASCDPDNIEHFHSCLSLCMKSKSTLSGLMEELQQVKKVYELRTRDLLSHLEKHPEHEEEWLRNASVEMKSMYKKLREETDSSLIDL